MQKPLWQQMEEASLETLVSADLAVQRYKNQRAAAMEDICKQLTREIVKKIHEKKNIRGGPILDFNWRTTVSHYEVASMMEGGHRYRASVVYRDNMEEFMNIVNQELQKNPEWNSIRVNRLDIYQERLPDAIVRHFYCYCPCLALPRLFFLSFFGKLYRVQAYIERCETLIE